MTSDGISQLFPTKSTFSPFSDVNLPAMKAISHEFEKFSLSKVCGFELLLPLRLHIRYQELPMQSQQVEFMQLLTFQEGTMSR